MSGYEAKWWEDHINLEHMVAYLFEHGDDQDCILYALSKPWKYTPEFERDWKDEPKLVWCRFCSSTECKGHKEYEVESDKHNL